MPTVSAIPDPEPFRLVFDREGASFQLAPSLDPQAIDHTLAACGAQALVVVPLLTEKRLARARAKVSKARGGDARENALDHAIAKSRARLEKNQKEAESWHAGWVELLDEKGAVRERLPAGLAFDLPRYRARLVAEDLGIAAIYWVGAGAIETHETVPLEEDIATDWGSFRDRSRDGLRDLTETLTTVHRRSWRDDLSRATRSAGLAPRGLCLAALGLLGLALAAIVSATTAPDNWTRSLFHPLLVLLPLLVYLVPRTAGAGANPRRDRSRPEAADAWRRIALHTLCIWALALGGVLALALANNIGARSWSPFPVANAFTSLGVVALWLLTPLTYARERGAALGALLESVLPLLISVFVLSITAIATAVFAEIVQAVAEATLPFQIPDGFQVPFQRSIELATDLFLFVVVAGYIWRQNQRAFGQWGRHPTEGDPATDVGSPETDALP